jgi:hypothetical protein
VKESEYLRREGFFWGWGKGSQRKVMKVQVPVIPKRGVPVLVSQWTPGRQQSQPDYRI